MGSEMGWVHHTLTAVYGSESILMINQLVERSYMMMVNTMKGLFGSGIPRSRKAYYPKVNETYIGNFNDGSLEGEGEFYNGDWRYNGNFKTGYLFRQNNTCQWR